MLKIDVSITLSEGQEPTAREAAILAALQLGSPATAAQGGVAPADTAVRRITEPAKEDEAPAKVTEPAEEDEAEAPKPKRTRRTKAQIEADRAAEEAAKKSSTQAAVLSEDADTDDAEEDEDDLVGSDDVTVEQVMAAVSELLKSDSSKRPAIKGLLAEHGAGKVRDIPEAELAAFMAKLQEV